MKKVGLLVLAISLLLFFTACSNTNKTQNTPSQSTVTNSQKPVVTEPAGPTDEELKELVSDLIDAEEDADRVASLLIQNWTTDSYFVYFYDESRFKGSSFEDEDEFADVHKYRKWVEYVLSETKEKLGATSSGVYYDAVKNYYTSLNSYLTLLSEYPTGYSKLTYATSISDCQNECRTARTDAEFYND